MTMLMLQTFCRACVSAVVLLGACAALADDPWVVLEGKEGPGKGKHVVFVTGDEEYRSEEGMPQLAKVLAKHHGFKCTVLFAVNPKTGEIEPTVVDNIPGLEALKTADLMVLFTRFRELPDEQMKHIMDYTDSGKPIVALRTATHPFFYRKNLDSPYAKWTWTNKDEAFRGGYGRQVLGETWGEPLRAPREGEHPGPRGRGHEGPSAGARLRGHLGPVRRVRDHHPPRRREAGRHGPGPQGHGPQRRPQP